jgi:hypothetical protein
MTHSCWLSVMRGACLASFRAGLHPHLHSYPLGWSDIRYILALVKRNYRAYRRDHAAGAIAA